MAHRTAAALRRGRQIGLPQYQHAKHVVAAATTVTSGYADNGRAVRELMTTVASHTGKGYQSMGSFHSDDVEELLKLPDVRFIVVHNIHSILTCWPLPAITDFVKQFLVAEHSWFGQHIASTVCAPSVGPSVHLQPHHPCVLISRHRRCAH
jgi:hypothetical protein